MIITIIGIDGSGKTTQTIKLAKALGKRGIRNRIYRPYFTYLFVDKIFHLFSGTTKTLRNKKGDFSNQKSEFFKLWIIITLLDNILTYFLYLKRYRREGILICDRYFFENIVAFVTEGICSTAIARGLIALIPKPDLIVWLDIDPVIAFERKPEHPLSIYFKLRNNYLQLLYNSQKLIVIDAKKSVSEISSNILDMCLKLTYNA